MEQKNKKPQLFISFRGEDVRLNLLPYLKDHLKGSEVKVVTDEDAIGGEPFENLFKYIRKSRIVIIIFSTKYLESDWCLNELLEIRRCLRTERVDYAIPIFYNVYASDIKGQTGEFKDQFLALQKDYPKSIKKWKKALLHICDFGGLSFHNNSSELDFVKRIVKKVDDVLEKVKEKDRNDNYSLTNRRYNLSKELEALNLQRNQEYYKRDDLLKHQSHNYCPPYAEVSSLSHSVLPYMEVSSLFHNYPPSTRDQIVPQDCSDTVHRRTNSFPDDINQIYFSSLLDETTVVQKPQFEAEESIDNSLQHKMIDDQKQQFENQVSIENNLQRKKPQFIRLLLQATTVFIIFRQLFFRK